MMEIKIKYYYDGDNKGSRPINGEMQRLCVGASYPGNCCLVFKYFGRLL